MALTPDQAKQLKDMLLEIEKISKALKKNIDATSLQDLEKNADAIKSLFGSLKKEWEDITDDISYAAVGFKKIVKEISNTNVGLKQSQKAYENLSSLANQIQSHQHGINELSSKELANKKKKAELARLDLSNAQELLKAQEKEQEFDVKKLESQKKKKEDDIELLKRQHASQDVIKEQQKILEDLDKKRKESIKDLAKTQAALKENASILEKENELYNGLISAIDDETRKAKNLEKALGLSGAAVDGIGKALNKAGLGALADQMGLDEAKEKMKEVAYNVTKGGTQAAGLVGQFKILKAGIGSLGSSIMKNLTDPLVLAGLAAKGVSAGVGLIKKGFSLLSGGVSSVVGFVKNLWGMADQFAAVFEKYAKAGQFAAQNFSAIGSQVSKITAGLNAAAAADPFMRVAEAGPALKAIVDGTGIMQTQMTKSVKEAHDLSYWLGYSAEETGQLYKLGQLNNETAKEALIDIKSQGALLNRQYKTSVDLRKVEQTAVKASAAVKMNLGQNTKALADAAFHATKLRMTLDEIANAAEQTLNFESSIQNQLEYQALTGREINIDAYQQAALRGDTATAAKELDRILQAQGGSIKGNVIAQEALAKTLGISKDKMMEALEAQKLAVKMGEDKEDVEKGINYYLSKGLSLQEASKKVSEEGLAKALQQSKRAEAMSRSLEDFRDFMATKLWPLFKAVFSPANIKMFMSVISGMRPVFVELGKAITAFFSPKSAGAMTDVIKNDVMPAILDLAKMLTEVAGVLGEALFGVIKTLGPVIKKDVIPIFKYIGSIIKEIAPSVGSLVKAFAGGLGKVFSKINEHKEDIREFIEILAKGLTNVFGFVADHLKEIAITLVAFKALTAVRSLKSAIMGAPGSSAMSPMYVKNVGMPSGAGGAAAGGGIMSKVKGFLGIGGKAAGAAGTTAGAMGSVAGTTSFAEKRKMVAARQAAGGGLGSKAASATTGAASAGGKLASTGTSAASSAGGAAGAGASSAGKFGQMAGGMLKGAAALLVLSGALYVAAKAFQEFGMVDWEDVGKGILTLGALGTAAFLLSKVEKDMIKGALAIGILGASLYPAAKALQEFASVSWESMGKAAAALIGLGTAAAILGNPATLEFIGMGALAIAGLGFSLIPLAAALNIAEDGLYALGDVLDKVLKNTPPIINAIADGLVRLATEANPIALIALGLSLSSLAIGITALGAAAAYAGIGEGIASALGGGGLFSMINSLIELSKVDFKPAAISLKDGILEIAKIGQGVDLGPFEEMFDDLEDAIEEIDIDDLKKFGDLKDIPFKEAAAKLQEGVQALANFNITGTEDVYKKLANLEWIFDIFEDTLRELDLEQIKEFSKLAGTSITASVTSLHEGIQALANINITGTKDVYKKLADLEWIFDIFEDTLRELDFEQIKEFSKLAGTSITDSVTSLQEGIQALANFKITGVDSEAMNLEALQTMLLGLEDVFDYFEDALAELDFKQIGEFSKLASVSMTYAVTSLQEGMQALVGLKITGSDDVELSLDAVKKIFLSLETLFDYFEDALAELDFAQISEFSKLASVSLKGAVLSLQEGMTELVKLDVVGKEGENGLIELKNKFKLLEDVFDELEDVIGELDTKKLVEFASLANSDLGKAGGVIIAGIEKLANDTYNTKEVNLDNIKASLETFNEAIGAIRFDKIKAFADLANSDLGLAGAKLVAGIQALATNTINAQAVDLTNITNALNAINEAFVNIRFDKIQAFADLSKGDLEGAATKITASIIYLRDNIKEGTADGLEETKDAFDAFNSAIGELKLDNIKLLGEIGSTKLELAGEKLKTGFNNFKTQFTGVKAEDYDFMTTVVKPIFIKIQTVFDEPATKMLEALKKFADTDYTKLSKAVSDFSLGLAEFKKLAGEGGIDEATLGSILTLFQSLNKIFNSEGGGLNLDNLIKFGTADFSGFKKSIEGFKEGLVAFRTLADELVVVVDGKQSFDVSKVETILTNLSKAFSGENIPKLVEFAGKDLSKFPVIIGHLKTAIDTLGKINTSNDFSTLNTLFTNIASSIASVAGAKNSIDIFISTDFAKLVTSITSFKSVVDTLGTLSVPAELGQTMLNIKTVFDILGGMGVLKDIVNIDGEAVYKVTERIASAIKEFSTLQAPKNSLEDILSSFSNALGKLDIDDLTGLAAVNVTNLPNVATSIKQFIDNAQSINFDEAVFDQIKSQLLEFRSAIGALDIEDLSKLAEVNGANLTVVSNSIKDVVSNWNNMTVGEDLVDKLDLFAEAINQLDIEDLNEFAGLNGANLLTASTSIKDAINAWIGLSVGEDLPTSLENFSNAIGELDIKQLQSLNEAKTENLQTNFANLKTSVDQFKDMADIAPAIKLINAFHKVLDVFFKADYSKSTVVSTIQELTKIDTTKLDSLKKSIDSLSTSFKGFGDTIKGMGDLSPVITVSTKMLELHQSLTKNPINEKAVQQLTEGVKAIFSSLMLGVIDFLVKNPNAINMNKALGGSGMTQTGNNGGGHDIKFSRGEVKSVTLYNGKNIGIDPGDEGVFGTSMQVATEDQLKLNKPTQNTTTSSTVVDNSAVIAAINKLTEIMASSTDKKIVVDVKSDIPAFVSKVRQTSFGG